MGGSAPHIGLRYRKRARHDSTLGEGKSIEVSGGDYKIKIEAKIPLKIQITSRIAGGRP